MATKARASSLSDKIHMGVRCGEKYRYLDTCVILLLCHSSAKICRCLRNHVKYGILHGALQSTGCQNLKLTRKCYCRGKHCIVFFNSAKGKKLTIVCTSSFLTA